MTKKTVLLPRIYLPDGSVLKGTWEEHRALFRKIEEREAERAKGIARCAIHGNVMICPRCVGKRGGQETARTHPGRHREWGRQGALAKGRK